MFECETVVSVTVATTVATASADLDVLAVEPGLVTTSTSTASIARGGESFSVHVFIVCSVSSCSDSFVISMCISFPCSVLETAYAYAFAFAYAFA